MAFFKKFIDLYTNFIKLKIEKFYMNKKLVIAIISAVVVIILIIIFFPKQECPTRCVCIGKRVTSFAGITDSVNIGGQILMDSTVFSCKGICLKNTCKKVTTWPSVKAADADHPINLESTHIRISKGDNGRLIVSVYNDGRFESNNVELLVGPCINQNGDNTSLIKLAAAKQPIKIGTDVGYAVIIIVNETINRDKYLCEIKASDGTAFLSEGLIVEVI